MKHQLDLTTWNRREHFAFFSQLEEPFWGLVADVDVTRARQRSRAQGVSFFQTYLHAVLTAVNAVENLRYRIEQGQVVCFDQINVSPTLLRSDNTFGFGFVPYQRELTAFGEGLRAEMAAVESSSGLRLGPETARLDVVHFSALPWVAFTSLSHARSFTHPDSIPKISVGRLRTEAGRELMPVSIHVHHGLADGYHVGLFMEALQHALDAA